MLLRLYGHFRDAVGRGDLRLELEGAITLEDLIRRLALRYDAFGALLLRWTDADLSSHAVFLRQGRHLRLSDRVEDQDCIDILVPATGG